MQNSITLTRLDTGAGYRPQLWHEPGLPKSWTWSWQASLHHTAAAHLGRDAQGDPADLLATINGVPFRLRLERVARDRRHLPQERYSVSGKGRAAILDAPWAPQMQFGNPLADYTAQQLAFNALTINGVPIGWDVDWQPMIGWCPPVPGRCRAATSPPLTTSPRPSAATCSRTTPPVSAHPAQNPQQPPWGVGRHARS